MVIGKASGCESEGIVKLRPVAVDLLQRNLFCRFQVPLKLLKNNK